MRLRFRTYDGVREQGKRDKVNRRRLFNEQTKQEQRIKFKGTDVPDVVQQRKVERKPVWEKTRDYFKTSAVVMTDRIVNGIYGLEVKKLSEQSKKVEQEHPKLSKTVKIITSWGFWYSMAKVGGELSKYTGEVIGYSIAQIHPVVVSLSKHFGNFKEGVKEMLKPSIRSYVLPFQFLELVSIPLFLKTLESVANLTSSTVGVGLAVISSTAAWASMLIFEFFGFKLFWKNLVLKDMEKGDWKQDLLGPAKNFNPFHLNKVHPVPKTSSEYVGQLLGIGLSNFVWLQGVRMVIAGLVSSIYSPSPSEFVNLLIQKSAEWKGWLDSIVYGYSASQVQSRIEEIEQQRISQLGGEQI